MYLVYNIKIVNKKRESYEARLVLENPKGEIRMVGNPIINLTNGEIASGEFFVIIHRDDLMDRNTKIKIGIYAGDKKLETAKTTFLGPGIRKSKKTEEIKDTLP